MAKIGWGEFVIILVIALIVLGPEKLPEAGRALGKAIRSVKRYVREATEEFEDLGDLKDIKADVADIQKDIRTMGESLERSVADDAEKLENDMKAAEKDLKDAVENDPPRPASAETETAEDTTPDEPTTQEEI